MKYKLSVNKITEIKDKNIVHRQGKLVRPCNRCQRWFMTEKDQKDIIYCPLCRKKTKKR